MQNYHPTWDLDSLFPGGSASKEFREYLESIKTGIHRLKDQLDTLNLEDDQLAEELAGFTATLE